MFLVGGYNDRPDIACTGLSQLQKAGISAELHIYSKVGHGFGTRKINKSGSSLWTQRFVEWLGAMKVF